MYRIRRHVINYDKEQHQETSTTSHMRASLVQEDSGPIPETRTVCYLYHTLD